jgi:hypothetical protein
VPLLMSEPSGGSGQPWVGAATALPSGAAAGSGSGRLAAWDAAALGACGRDRAAAGSGSGRLAARAAAALAAAN